MIRFINVNEGKNLLLRKASETMTRGMAVTLNYANETVGKATATTDIYLVDVDANYNGINAVIAPTDGSFEDIAVDQMVILVPAYVGERYATTELTIGALTKGALLKAAAGEFVAAVSNDVCEWCYGGTYSDATGKTMYVVERIMPTKQV